MKPSRASALQLHSRLSTQLLCIIPSSLHLQCAHHAAQAQGYAASAVVLVAEPKVKEEIDTRVLVFRDSALQALPQQV
jgi:hypothetical protein